MRTLLLMIVLSGTLLGLSAPYADAGETIDDAAAGFKLTLPDGFTAVEDSARLMAGTSYGFVYGEVEEGKINVVLLIMKQDEPLPHRRLRRGDLPANFTGRLDLTTWQGLDVPVGEIREEANGLKGITYSVLIPLERQAVNLKLIGPAERETELKSLLSQIIAGLTGRSNWPSSPPAMSLPQHSGRSWIVAMVIVVLAGLIVLWLISRYIPGRTALIISVILFFGANGLTSEKTVVATFTAASMKFIGLAGIILGIGDSIARRRSRRAAREPDDKAESAPQAKAD